MDFALFDDEAELLAHYYLKLSCRHSLVHVHQHDLSHDALLVLMNVFDQYTIQGVLQFVCLIDGAARPADHVPQDDI